MPEITEPSKQQKEEAAYRRILGILRSQGLTAEEIEAHPETVNHPGRPSSTAVATAAAATMAAVQVTRSEAKGPAQSSSKKTAAEKPKNGSKNVPIVDANAGPPITQLPKVLDGAWDEKAGDEADKEADKEASE